MKIPLVLLPGLLCNETVWEHQIRHLSALAEIQVITSTQDTPEKMVSAILNQAPPKFSLAGHSMGGWLCLEIMKSSPERVNKLCLLNTTMRADSPEKRNKRLQMIKQAEEGHFSEVIEEGLPYFVHDPQVKEKVRKMFLEEGEKTFVAQEKSMLARKECETLLPTIRCPVLTIHASYDKIFSLEEHQELRDKIPGAKLAIIEDSGHMSPMEAPQAVTALLRYWLDYY